MTDRTSHHGTSSLRLAPRILTHAGDLLGNYDVIFCDVWGVVHNGFTAYAAACAALERFRSAGGTVILVSNAPVPKARVAAMLDSRAVPRSSWDDIVSSGDIALRHIEAKHYGRIYCIGPHDRDSALFDRVKALRSPLDDADAILCSGLNDDRTETAEDYRPVLDVALRRGVPFVCANPDLVVDVGGVLYPCAGAIADLYEHMGGPVFWAGKPHESAYTTALEAARAVRGSDVERTRILAVGDALRTDIAGAAKAGIDAIFIASGIHRDDTTEEGRIVPEKLRSLFGPDSPPAIAAMAELAW
jgi:HAD superfamily hydrolase (TIGR01459 family)